MDIIVLCGGLSPERDVSLKSGAMIARALRENGHRVAVVDAFFGYTGEYTDPKEIFDCPCGDPEAEIAENAPDLSALAALRSQKNRSRVADDLLEVCRAADMVFLGLHGADGEDGRLQAMLDIAGIPYTGSGHLGSAIAMDKVTAKRLMREAGVNTPEGVTVTRATAHAPAPFLPCVVKPRSGGSSVGTSVAKTEGEYADALQLGFGYADELLVERYIQGREIDVGVLDGEALPPIEIAPKSGFFDYKNKYQPGAARELCPIPDLPEALDRALRETALRVNDALGLAVYARMDFIVDRENKIWCLEANTLPGMTQTSLLPQEAQAAGIGYNELCERILEASRAIRTL